MALFAARFHEAQGDSGAARAQYTRLLSDIAPGLFEVWGGRFLALTKTWCPALFTQPSSVSEPFCTTPVWGPVDCVLVVCGAGVGHSLWTVLWGLAVCWNPTPNTHTF